ncbi:hypothetical protein [uncultured Cohaesibacter sp.]|nr:hypothetical protein [uncultured Cohaesibacter sp.]
MADNMTSSESQTKMQRLVRSITNWHQDFIDCLAFFTRMPVPAIFGSRK